LFSVEREKRRGGRPSLTREKKKSCEKREVPGERGGGGGALASPGKKEGEEGFPLRIKRKDGIVLSSEGKETLFFGGEKKAFFGLKKERGPILILTRKKSGSFHPLSRIRRGEGHQAVHLSRRSTKTNTKEISLSEALSSGDH